MWKEIRNGCDSESGNRCYLMGYSSAASAVGEDRAGLMRLQDAVGDGEIDAWVD